MAYVHTPSNILYSCVCECLQNIRVDTASIICNRILAKGLQSLMMQIEINEPGDPFCLVENISRVRLIENICRVK